jgi:hypothetical protein
LLFGGLFFTIFGGLFLSTINCLEGSTSLKKYNDSVKQKQKFYREGELLGNETRNTEFKEGGGEHFIKKNLKDIVSRYMSGFLNSSQQGTLFIGVKDDG